MNLFNGVSPITGISFLMFCIFGILFAVGASFGAKNLYFILKQKFVNF